MSSIDLIITFDTEDVYTPASRGMDDIPKRLAEIMTAEGVQANFMLLASRARLLKERGRQDVIAALTRHCIGVHTLSHDQPYHSVAASDLDWAGGLEVCRQSLTKAHQIISEAFDCEPVCLSDHASNSAPQDHVVARELGLPYVYGYPTLAPLFNMTRYCGALNIPWPLDWQETPRPYFEMFDDVIFSEPDFLPYLDRFFDVVDAMLAQKQPAMLLHPFHPFRLYNADWTDGYMTANGVNIPREEWARRPGPPQHTPAEVELSLRNFQRLIHTIRHHPSINVLTIREAAAKYGRFPAQIGRLDLMAAAQRACMRGQVAIEERYSPAEVILGWAGALLAFARDGSLPESQPRNNDCLGPVQDPIIIPEEPGEAGWQVVLGLADALLQAARTTGYLPANLSLPGGARVGLGSVYRALAEAYLVACNTGQAPASVRLLVFPRQPQVGVAIGEAFTRVAESRLVKPDMNITSPYRYGKLQCWTLAPAWYA